MKIFNKIRLFQHKFACTNDLAVQIDHIKTLELQYYPDSDDYNISSVLHLLAEHNKVIEELSIPVNVDMFPLDEASKISLLKLTTLQTLRFIGTIIDSPFFIECAKRLKHLGVFSVTVDNFDIELPGMYYELRDVLVVWI